VTTARAGIKPDRAAERVAGDDVPSETVSNCPSGREGSGLGGVGPLAHPTEGMGSVDLFGYGGIAPAAHAPLLARETSYYGGRGPRANGSEMPWRASCGIVRGVDAPMGGWKGPSGGSVVRWCLWQGSGARALIGLIVSTVRALGLDCVSGCGWLSGS
jgi:hypothetical protein